MTRMESREEGNCRKRREGDEQRYYRVRLIRGRGGQERNMGEKGMAVRDRGERETEGKNNRYRSDVRGKYYRVSFLKSKQLKWVLVATPPLLFFPLRYFFLFLCDFFFFLSVSSVSSISVFFSLLLFLFLFVSSCFSISVFLLSVTLLYFLSVGSLFSLSISLFFFHYLCLQFLSLFHLSLSLSLPLLSLSLHVLLLPSRNYRLGFNTSFIFFSLTIFPLSMSPY